MGEGRTVLSGAAGGADGKMLRCRLKELVVLLVGKGWGGEDD